MASVYLGYRADVDRTVAIKVLPPHPGLSEESKQRFHLEARHHCQATASHILPLYDYGVTEDGVLYLDALRAGGSLDRIIRDGHLPWRNRAAGAGNLRRARLCSPSGVIIAISSRPNPGWRGNALLADFGIVKLTGGDSR